MNFIKKSKSRIFFSLFFFFFLGGGGGGEGRGVKRMQEVYEHENCHILLQDTFSQPVLQDHIPVVS